MALYNATDGDNWTRKDDWLSDEPLGNWYGVTTDGNGRVTNLYIRTNNLSGTVPSLSALTDLEELDLYGNSLSGSIPDFGALTELKVLNLGGNDLTGSIPNLNALTQLKELKLYGNELTALTHRFQILVRSPIWQWCTSSTTS